MTPETLLNTAQAHMRRLCVEIPSRRVGSAGNRAATDFFADIAVACGWAVETPAFECMDWIQDGVELIAAGAPFEAFASPYSLGCAVRAPLRVVSTTAELEAADIAGALLLLRGDIAAGQLMPKNFPFYNPDEHKRIIALLEAKRPAAIIAATWRDAEMVGAQYPFPLIEDGDFDIPSVYMTDVEGTRLATYAGREVQLHSRAERISAAGCNVIARKGAHPNRRVVLFAHIDARLGSPGAGDNASGVAVLLLLAELLADYAGDLTIELVAMNGEDYYSNPGEQQYLARNAGRFDEIAFGINIDDVGYHKGKVAYSLYDCPAGLAAAIRRAFAGRQTMFIEGPPWYQGDHGLLLMQGRPALALTSELVAELMATITHTPQDTPDKVAPAKLVETALALRDLLLHLSAVP